MDRVATEAPAGLTPSGLRRLSLAAAALAIAACLVAISVGSPAFAYEIVPSTENVARFFVLAAGAGAAYLLFAALTPRARIGGRTLAAFVALGAAARLAFFGSTPIYEDDWYRYLWDGAVVAEGVNPYVVTPADASLTDAFGAPLPATNDADVQRLRALGASLDHWPERINYPFVSTIYPPLAQAAFAAANLITPFDLDAWRVVLLAADAAGLALLFALLKRVGRRAHWALLYWLNPIVILTTYNAAHMDVLLAPFLLGATLLVLADRPAWAGASLGAAVAVKFWPAMLAPLLFRRWLGRPARLAVAALALAVATAAFVGPMLASLDFDRSGLVAYANTWRRNAFLFPLIARLFDGIAADPDLAARCVAALVPLSYIAWATVRRPRDDASALRRLPEAMLVSVLIFYLFSPTGYPWYATWFFLFAPFARPNGPATLGAIALAATLPIYYLRFSLERLGQADYFNNVLAPIEFGAPIALVLGEAARRTLVARWKAAA
ncbi:MAG: glycosyltransferase 87 family protein [Parvularculaceae bacterium]